MLLLDVLKDRITEKKYVNAEKKSAKKVYNHDKIRVVFVCHRPQIWNSLRTIYENCVKDSDFEVIIVTIPNKKQLPKKGLHHELYESEGAEKFYKDFDCKVIEGYNYNTGEWLDLKSLEPDYLFYQTPYDISRPYQYRSAVVSQYTKLCYISYGMPFMGGEIAEQSFPIKYLKNTYFQFVEFPEMGKYYENRIGESKVRRKENVVLTGYPKLDEASGNVGNEGNAWIYKEEEKKFRIMWTPRWTTDEGNCTFFELKDNIVRFAENNQNIELLFRPHPQAFDEYYSKGEMTKQEIEEYKAKFESMPNASIDKEKEYLPSFYSTDVLISDESSIIPEYFLTGKPMIFTYKETHLNELAVKLAEGFYWAKNWEEVNKYLEMLKKGEDPLKEKRQEIIKANYYLPEKGAGFEIKELIKKDFYAAR